MKFLKSLWNKIAKAFRGSTSKDPETKVSETPITETPEVEQMTQRLIDVSSKPLTVEEEKLPSVKEIKSKSVKKKEPAVKPAKKVATKTAKAVKKDPKKK